MGYDWGFRKVQMIRGLIPCIPEAPPPLRLVPPCLKLNNNPLHLIEGHFIGAPVIELRRAGADQEAAGRRHVHW